MLINKDVTLLINPGIISHNSANKSSSHKPVTLLIRSCANKSWIKKHVTLLINQGVIRP